MAPQEAGQRGQTLNSRGLIKARILHDPAGYHSSSLKEGSKTHYVLGWDSLQYPTFLHRPPTPPTSTPPPPPALDAPTGCPLQGGGVSGGHWHWGPHCLWTSHGNWLPGLTRGPHLSPEPPTGRAELALPSIHLRYSLRPRLVATCCSTSICLMASLRVKCTTSTQ